MLRLSWSHPEHVSQLVQRKCSAPLFHYHLRCHRRNRSLVHHRLPRRHIGDKRIDFSIFIFFEFIYFFKLLKKIFLLIKQGSLIATLLAYVMPSLCTLIIQFRNSEREKTRKILFSSLVCLIGLIVVASGSISALDKLRNGFSCSHGNLPSYCQASSNQQLHKITANSTTTMTTKHHLKT